MKKSVITLLGMFFVVIAAVAFGAADVSAAAKKNYITNSAFQGTYTIGGNEVSFESGGYELVIGKITAKNKVVFQLHRWSANAGKLCDSNKITAQIKGNKASFKFTDSYQGASGEGVLVFNKDKTVSMEVKSTKYEGMLLYGLDIEKTKFGKVSGEHKLY